MAEAEYAGIGAFLTELGSAWKGRREEQKRKHDQWMNCIMGGTSAEDCTRILGYDPGEEARVGAESIEARRRAEKIEEQHQKRFEFGRETAEKYTSIPVEEAGELDIPVDWKQAMITPERVTTAVKMTPAQISEAHWKRGKSARDIVKEKRKEAKEREELEEKRVYEEDWFTRQQKIKAKYKTPKEETNKRKELWEKYVAKIHDINTKGKAEATGFAYEPITPMTWNEFNASFKESKDPKAEAQKAFDWMANEKYSREDMLEIVEGKKAKLLSDGVDIAYLLELIEGLK